VCGNGEDVGGVVYCSCQAYPTGTVRSKLGKSKRCTRGTETLETTVEFFCYMIVHHTRAIYHKASRMRTSLIASKGIVSLPAPCNAHCRVFSIARLPMCSRGSLHNVSRCTPNTGVRVDSPMACSLDNHDLASLDQIVASVVKRESLIECRVKLSHHECRRGLQRALWCHARQGT